MPKSDWATLWTGVRCRVAELRKELSLADFATLWWVAMGLHAGLKREQTSMYERFGFGESSWHLFWRDLLSREADSNCIQKLGVELPDDIREFAAKEHWFDATQYWLNWDD